MRASSASRADRNTGTGRAGAWTCGAGGVAADNNYVPMLTTTIYSMLKNASTNRMYDVVVLERNITDENKRYIRQFFARFSNALIRFFDVNRYLAGFNLTTSNAHISIETY